MLGNRCNFACDYCPDELHNGSIPWIGIEQATAFLEQVHDHYVTGLGHDVWLQLTGGEPTQYPKFFDLCEVAHGLSMNVAVISNGSRTERFWERACGVLASVILTYHDLQVTHETFLTTIRTLVRNRVPLHINVTAHPDRFDDILARVEEILDVAEDASLTLKPLRIGFGSKLYPYTDAQMETLSRRHSRPKSTQGTDALRFQRGLMRRRTSDGAETTVRASELLLEGQNSWKGNRCRAGLESLRVNASGAVTRAVCGAGGEIGRLGDDIAFPVVSVTCPRDECACVSDILVTKTAPFLKR